MSRAWRGRRRNREERESGQTVVEFVLWTPVLFGCIAFAMQAGMYLWAEHVAQAAAQSGAVTAQDEYSSDHAHWYDDSQQAALGQIAQLAPSLLENPHAIPSQAGTTVTVTVTAHVPPILWPWMTSVSVSASGPIEQWTAP